MRHERPLISILQDEQTKLYFHDLILYLESKAYINPVNRNTNIGGEWEEQNLHYEYSNSVGNSTVELHIDNRYAYVTLFEYSYDKKVQIHGYWSWRITKYKTKEAIKNLTSKSEIYQLFSNTLNQPYKEPLTDMDYKLDIERQQELFKEVINYLLKLGFNQENQGCLDIHLSYIDDKFDVSVEMGEHDGIVDIMIHEDSLITKLKSSTNWEEITVDFNANELIKCIVNSFHISKLK